MYLRWPPTLYLSYVSPEQTYVSPEQTKQDRHQETLDAAGDKGQ